MSQPRSGSVASIFEALLHARRRHIGFDGSDDLGWDEHVLLPEQPHRTCAVCREKHGECVRWTSEFRAQLVRMASDQLHERHVWNLWYGRVFSAVHAPVSAQRQLRLRAARRGTDAWDQRACWGERGRSSAARSLLVQSSRSVERDDHPELRRQQLRQQRDRRRLEHSDWWGALQHAPILFGHVPGSVYERDVTLAARDCGPRRAAVSFSQRDPHHGR